MDNIKTGILIAKKRKEKQLTQKDLADKLGVSNATVSKWETGKGFPDISLLEPLASVLGFSVSEILSGEEKVFPEEHTELLLKDMVELSVKEQEAKKKRYNWIIAITVAVLYLTVSLLTGKWQWTWIIWFVYCFYRILTEYMMKR
jgi:transcriptional regulator with XRE-family HTH domain